MPFIPQTLKTCRFHFYIWILLGLLVPISGCFHKDLMEDRADDIQGAWICPVPSGDLLVVKESVFQATSKKSGGGITQISGYNEFRLSAYDLSTGKLAGRVELGEGIDEECLVIGCVNGRIWCYSVDEELGFHSRTLPGLEVEFTESQLSATGPLAGFSFARPEWSRLGDFYQTDERSISILMSDMQGNSFQYNPAAGTLVPYTRGKDIHIWPSQLTSSTAELSDDVSIGFEGDGRERPTWKGEILPVEFSFLQPEYLLESDPVKLAAMRDGILNGVNTELKVLGDSLNALRSRFPGVDEEGARYWEFPAPKRDAHDKVVDLKYQIEDIQRDLSHAWTMTGFVDHYPLRADSTSLFVLHAANIADTAGILVSRMDLSGKQCSLSWTTPLPGIFRDPSAADSKGAFETVFSKGDPEFDFKWFAVRNGRLIMIYQLEMIALDVTTGAVLWRIPI